MDNNSLTDINKSMDNNSVNESIECFKKLIMSFGIQKIRTKILKNRTLKEIQDLSPLRDVCILVLEAKAPL